MELIGFGASKRMPRWYTNAEIERLFPTALDPEEPSELDLLTDEYENCFDCQGTGRYEHGLGDYKTCSRCGGFGYHLKERSKL